MPGDDSEEKTEDATPRQRERSREEGQVASSREVGTLFVLTAATIGIYSFGPYMTERSLALFIGIFENLATTDVSIGGTTLLMQNLFIQILLILTPLMIILTIASIAGYVIQFGFLFTAKSIQPKGSRINPVEGAKRIFSARMLMETVKSIFKFLVVGLVSYMVYRSIFPGAVSFVDVDPRIIIPTLLDLGLKLSIYLIIFLLAVALSDYVYHRWEYEKSIRMSRYEIKQELKETEGDPQIKARVRSIRQQQARMQMMAEVPKAEVVITNPTHIAIALQYEPEKYDAPRVVAKGRGLIAQRIREIAEEHEIPIVEDRWLARQLEKNCDVGDVVPVDLWQAVARVLAYVRTLDQRRKLAVGV